LAIKGTHLMLIDVFVKSACKSFEQLRL